MSINEATRFADRLETDDAFATSLAGATDPAAIYQVVLDNGFDVQPEEIRAVFLERHGDELTPEQLDAVNGGMSTIEILSISLSAANGVVTLAAAAW